MEFEMIDNLTGDAVSLTKSINDYTFSRTFEGVMLVIIFVFILTVLYVYVMNSRTAVSLQKKINNNIDLIMTMLKVLQDTQAVVVGFMQKGAFRSVSIDQARALIASEFEKTKLEIIANIVKVKQKNNLDDKSSVSDKAVLFIDLAYTHNMSMLQKFELEGKSLHMFMQDEWKRQVFEQVLKDCATAEIDVYKLESTYDNIFKSFKAELNMKLDNVI